MVSVETTFAREKLCGISVYVGPQCSYQELNRAKKSPAHEAVSLLSRHHCQMSLINNQDTKI